MKKAIVILAIACMVVAGLFPLVSADPDRYGYDGTYSGDRTPQDTHATGSITYKTDGSGVKAQIACIWEARYGDREHEWDDDITKPGMQLNPPMRHDANKSIWVYVGVWDLPNHVTSPSDLKVHISWPDNLLVDISGRLGDGTNKVENLEMEAGEYADYENACYYNNLPGNDNFICYYNGFDNSESSAKGIPYEEGEYNMKWFKISYPLYYHDPAGWYDIHVSLVCESADSQINYFEYVMGIGIEIDYSFVDWSAVWGDVTGTNVVYKYDGDWNWDLTQSPAKPTARSVGNWDSKLGVFFSRGTFQYDTDVEFDVRVGEANPANNRYNRSYSEVHFNPSEMDYMNPGEYWGLPIDNIHMNPAGKFNDLLLKCHTVKLDFYVIPNQWSSAQGDYTWDMDLLVQAPDNSESNWMWPVQRNPCDGTQIAPTP